MAATDDFEWCGFVSEDAVARTAERRGSVDLGAQQEFVVDESYAHCCSEHEVRSAGLVVVVFGLGSDADADSGAVCEGRNVAGDGKPRDESDFAVAS